jgi:hypothetical protein
MTSQPLFRCVELSDACESYADAQLRIACERAARAEAYDRKIRAAQLRGTIGCVLVAIALAVGAVWMVLP